MSDADEQRAYFERSDFVAGQVHALKAIIFALIKSHPNVTAVRTELAKARAAAEARTVPEPVSDDFLEGMNEVFDHAQAFADAGGNS
jgi:hypothetical protein